MGSPLEDGGQEADIRSREENREGGRWKSETILGIILSWSLRMSFSLHTTVQAGEALKALTLLTLLAEVMDIKMPFW